MGSVHRGQMVLNCLEKQDEQSMKCKCISSVFSWFLHQGLALVNDRLQPVN